MESAVTGTEPEHLRRGEQCSRKCCVRAGDRPAGPAHPAVTDDLLWALQARTHQDVIPPPEPASLTASETGSFLWKGGQNSHSMCTCKLQRILWVTAAWADPYRTWLERKGEGKGESPRVLIPSGPWEKAASGPSLLLRQPPLLPRHQHQTSHG